MKLTKKAISTVIVFFIVMTITSVTTALPVSSQTVSVEIVKAWPQWRRYKLSEHPYQILYAKAKNTGTEPVYIKVKFCVVWIEGAQTSEYWSYELELLTHPPTAKLVLILIPGPCGHYSVTATLWYKAAGALDYTPNGWKSFNFVVVE